MPGFLYRSFPCAECPWRRDVPPGQFTAERFEALRVSAGAPGAEVCHSPDVRLPQG